MRTSIKQGTELCFLLLHIMWTRQVKSIVELSGICIHWLSSTYSISVGNPLPYGNLSRLTTTLFSCLILPECPKITWSPCALLPQHTQTYRNSKPMNQGPLTSFSFWIIDNLSFLSALSSDQYNTTSWAQAWLMTAHYSYNEIHIISIPYHLLRLTLTS